MTEEEKEQEENIKNNMPCEELAESDSDYEDATSQHSSLEDVSLGSSGTLLYFFVRFVYCLTRKVYIYFLDEDYSSASTSTAKPKSKATKSTRKSNLMTERKSNTKSYITYKFIYD